MRDEPYVGTEVARDSRPPAKRVEAEEGAGREYLGSLYDTGGSVLFRSKPDT
jgi:hypothetical protein